MEAIATAQQMPHWRAVLESAGEGIYGISNDGRCTFVNRTATELFGYSTDEMIGNNVHELVHHHHPDGSVYQQEDCSITSVLRGGDPFREQLDTLFRKSGESFTAEISAQPVTENETILGVVVTVRDVSRRRAERAELEKAYREAETRRAELDAVIDSIPHGVYIARHGDSSLRCNRRAIALSGPDFPEDLKTLDLALKGQSSNDVVQQQGRWLRSSAAPILLNGEIIGAVAVNSDVTQSRMQEEALRKTEKLAAVGQLASSKNTDAKFGHGECVCFRIERESGRGILSKLGRGEVE